MCIFTHRSVYELIIQIVLSFLLNDRHSCALHIHYGSVYILIATDSEQSMWHKMHASIHLPAVTKWINFKNLKDNITLDANL